MPAFIKTKRDEELWSRSKAVAHNQYPDMSEDDESFWKVTTGIYKKMRGGIGKRASAVVTLALRKVAGESKSLDDIINQAKASFRAVVSRVKPADIPELPASNPGLHPLARHYNFADRARLDPDAKSWSNTGSLPEGREAARWNGKYKCNAFVQQAAAGAFGNKSIFQHPNLGRTLMANEVHTGLRTGKPYNVGGGYMLHPISAEEAAMLPGSIVTSGDYNNSSAVGHIGITPGFGERASISAASSAKAKGVVKNDWGWRKGQDYLYGMLVPEGEDAAAYKARMLDFVRKLINADPAVRQNYFRTIKK